jgi:hypothetical protein
VAAGFMHDMCKWLLDACVAGWMGERNRGLWWHYISYQKKQKKRRRKHAIKHISVDENRLILMLGHFAV